MAAWRESWKEMVESLFVRVCLCVWVCVSERERERKREERMGNFKILKPKILGPSFRAGAGLKLVF